MKSRIPLGGGFYNLYSLPNPPVPQTGGTTPEFTEVEAREGHEGVHARDEPINQRAAEVEAQGGLPPHVWVATRHSRART